MKGIIFYLVPRLVVYDKYQLRYTSICMYTPTCKNCIKGYHGNHAISQDPNVFIFQEHCFLIHGVHRNNLAPMKTCHGGARQGW